MTCRGVYVTGTDTAVGKTLVSCTLLHALRARGLRATGMKPLASGCIETLDGWRNDDALALQVAGDPCGDYGDINPIALPNPLAPELAARDAGVVVSLAPILAAYARLSASADVVVVEGVGGWAAPLAAGIDQSMLVQALRLPVVLVVGLRLGCISHARLAAAAIEADGARLAGWIASEVDPDMQRIDDNMALLRARLPAPCLGRLAHCVYPLPATLAAGLSTDALLRDG